MKRESTTRFSHCVDDYVRYRPGYPDAVIGFLRTQSGMTQKARVADIGAGSGALTRLLLPHVAEVFAVEPNAAMRRAADASVMSAPAPAAAGAQRARYVSLDGTAEATSLADHSIDLIVAAQAFHWFDPHSTRQEWRRILRPGAHAALVWNRRDRQAHAFMQEYDELLHRWVVGYAALDHARIDDEALAAFYGGDMQSFSCPHTLSLDLASLLGRLRSASYCPTPGDDHYLAFFDAMQDAFLRHARDGRVNFVHTTVAYTGTLAA